VANFNRCTTCGILKGKSSHIYPKEICICLNCKKEFLHRRCSKNMFCSRKCHYSFIKGKSFIELFGVENAIKYKESLRKSAIERGIKPPVGSHKGKYHSLETRIKISIKKQGINKEKWKGFITEERKKQRNSKEWKMWREAVFERDNYTCQDCSKRGGELQPHHIKSRSLFPELIFNVDNGKTLCKECHGFEDILNRERNEQGRLL